LNSAWPEMWVIESFGERLPGRLNDSRTLDETAEDNRSPSSTGTGRDLAAILLDQSHSEDSAALHVEDTIQGLALNEFFLLLSSTGLACRRCQLEAVNGGDIAVRFCA
jgi:hypothetical protein